jgi:hypothetical protein
MAESNITRKNIEAIMAERAGVESASMELGIGVYMNLLVDVLIDEARKEIEKICRENKS